MTDLQNKYDILLEDIKLLLQYDDKYMKIDKNKLVKPNILNELEKKISDIKQKKSGIALQIKKNDDKKELLINDISSINTQNTNIETEINELSNNTKIIQEEQKSKLDLINSKCKELEELCNLFEKYNRVVSHNYYDYNCTIKCIGNTTNKIIININKNQIDNNIIKDIIFAINNIYIVLLREYILHKEGNNEFNILDDLNKPINYTQLYKKINIEEKYIKRFLDISISDLNGGNIETPDEYYQYQTGNCCNFCCEGFYDLKKQSINVNGETYSDLFCWGLFKNIYDDFIIIKNKINKYKNELINLEIYENNNIDEQEYKYNYEYENITNSLNELVEMKNNILEQIKQNKVSNNTIDTIEQHLRLNKIQLELTEQITLYTKQRDKINLLITEYKLESKTNIESKKQLINNLLKDFKIQGIYKLFTYNNHIRFLDEDEYRKQTATQKFNISKKIELYLELYLKDYNDRKFVDEIEFLTQLNGYIISNLPGIGCDSGKQKDYYGGSSVRYPMTFPKNKNSKYIELFNSLYKNTLKDRIYVKELEKMFEIICEDEIDNLDLDIFNIYDDKMNKTMIIMNKSKEQYMTIIKNCRYIYDTIYNTNIISDYILNNLEIKEEINKINKKISELNTNSSKNIDIIKQKNDKIQNILSLNTNLILEIDNYNIEISTLEDEFIIIEKVYNLKKLYTS